jgi:hypothetical protein
LDAVWFSSVLPSRTKDAAFEPGRSITRDDFSGLTVADESDSTEKTIPSIEGKRVHRNLHAAGFGTDSMSRRGDSFKLPRVPALPQILQLERGLRSLVRRVDSSVEMVLDEDATAIATAEVGRLQLRLRPTKVRSLSATIVIEHSPTMRFWLDHLSELPKLFWRTGGFRNLETLFLNSFKSPPTLFYDRQLKRTANLRRVTSGNASGVIFYVTDGRSTPWLDGTLSAILSDWSRQQTTVVLTVTDSNLWSKTAIQNSRLVVCRLRWPLGPAQCTQLKDTTNQTCVPVIPITPEKIKRLGPLIWADIGSETSFFRLDITNDLIGESAPSISLSPTEKLGTDNFDRFMRTASPEAISLARSFASIPLFLPIMRLTQHCLHPNTGISQLAEILWSGMVYRRDYQTPIAPGSNTNHIEFDFLPGVRDRLLDQASIHRVSNVFDVLTRYLATSYDYPSHLGAILDNPRGLIEWSASGHPDNQKPFARVASQVLKRLGGEYEEVGSKLEELSEGQREEFVRSVTPEKRVTDAPKHVVAMPSPTNNRVKEEEHALPYPNADVEVEDGTNLKKGTKYSISQRSRPRDLYVPSKAEGSHDWQQKLKRLLRQLNEQAGTSKVGLRFSQMRIPEYPGRSEGNWLESANANQFRSGFMREDNLGSLMNERGIQLFGEFPISDVTGNPIQNSVGEPFGFRYGFSRSIVLYGDQVDKQILQLLQLGCKLLSELPSDLATQIWKYWPDGFAQDFFKQKELWLNALLEFGWNLEPDDPLFIPRFAMSDDLETTLFLSGKGHFPRIPKSSTKKDVSRISHENGFPVEIYSEIDDIIAYSIRFVYRQVELAKDKGIGFRIKPTIVPEPTNPLSVRMRTFISYSREDREMARNFAELLRMHYIPFFLDELGADVGKLENVILSEIDKCSKFVVLISPAALKSEWVRQEVKYAIESNRFNHNDFLPILIKPLEIAETWMELHSQIREWRLLDFVSQRVSQERRLIEEVYKRPRHTHDYYQVGDVKIQAIILAGGDGKTRYQDGDILCNGPTHDQSHRKYELPGDVQTHAADLLAIVRADCNKRGVLFVNNPQVRLVDYAFGSGRPTGGISSKPLRLELGWTEYYHTRLTNQTREYILPDGQSIALKYGYNLEDLVSSRLSNPIATNMSVVTSDRKIFVATRTPKVAWNPGGYQPAVSGDGQPEDLTAEGIYDPIHTAMREGQEECFGDYNIQREHVTFFGLARTMGTQFPFLFGEIRVPITSHELLSFLPSMPEGQRIPLDFTIEAVCKWICMHHLDHYEGRQTGVIGTTLFSLLQSLHYEYPERWLEVARALKVT